MPLFLCITNVSEESEDPWRVSLSNAESLTDAESMHDPGTARVIPLTREPGAVFAPQLLRSPAQEESVIRTEASLESLLMLALGMPYLPGTPRHFIDAALKAVFEAGHKVGAYEELLSRKASNPPDINERLRELRPFIP